MATRAPEATNRSVMALPKPCAPPVTTALRPSRSIWFFMGSSLARSSVHKSRARATLQQTIDIGVEVQQGEVVEMDVASRRNDDTTM
jgi:hypothetical protein